MRSLLRILIYMLPFSFFIILVYNNFKLISDYLIGNFSQNMIYLIWGIIIIFVIFICNVVTSICMELIDEYISFTNKFIKNKEKIKKVNKVFFGKGNILVVDSNSSLIKNIVRNNKKKDEIIILDFKKSDILYEYPNIETFTSITDIKEVLRRINNELGENEEKVILISELDQFINYDQRDGKDILDIISLIRDISLKQNPNIKIIANTQFPTQKLLDSGLLVYFENVILGLIRDKKIQSGLINNKEVKIQSAEKIVLKGTNDLVILKKNSEIEID